MNAHLCSACCFLLSLLFLSFSSCQPTSQRSFLHYVSLFSSQGSKSATSSQAGGTTTQLPSSPNGLTYTGSPFEFLMGSAITTVTPSVNGTVTNCVSNPTLPTGLSLNALTCAITGTPTVWQSNTNYTITANNSAGNATTTIGIAVTSDASSWTARTMPSAVNWYGVAYGLSRFIVIALTSNAVASSP